MFAVAQDRETHGVADMRQGIRKMAEGNLADVGFLVVAILINRFVRYGKNYVSFSQSGFLGGTSGTDLR